MRKYLHKLYKRESIIVILLVVAVVLGVSIYLKNRPATEGNYASTNKAGAVRVSPVDEKLMEEERILFHNPGPDAPRSDFDTFFSQVNKSAVDGDKIVINDCKATPLVLRVKYESTFTVENKGAQDINFGFESEKTLVKAGTSKKIKANYKNGHGIYGYGCDNPEVARSIGVLLITP